MEDTRSPAPAATAEEAMSSRESSRDTVSLPGDAGASGGAAALGGAMAAAGAEGGREESVRDSEAWTAAVPPVRTLYCSLFIRWFSAVPVQASISCPECTVLSDLTCL